MAYEQRPGQFSLFKNDKEGNDKRPDYKGDGMDLNGNLVRVSAWLRDGAKGKYMSCKFELKEGGQAAPARPAAQKPDDNGFDDGLDIPF